NLNVFYRYVPGAGQWIPSNTGFESLTVWDFSAFGPVLFAATSAGPFISVPPYLSWQSFYDGLTQVDIDRIFAHDSTIWALSEVKAYCSTDNGMHFTPHSFESLSLPRQMILSDSIYFMIAADSVYISSDQGNTWVDISNGLPYNPQPPLLHLNSLAVSGNFLFLGTSDGLFRTEHHNYQWMQIPSLNSPNLKSIDLVLHDSILLVIKGVGADDLRYYLFRSVDAGDTFDSVSGPSPVYFPLIEAGQEDFFASVFHELFRSTDGGASWTEVPAGCPSGRVTGIAVKEPSMILAGINFASFSPCLTVTYDNGQNWINIYENLPWSGWPEVNLVEINQERVFAAPLGNGLWYQGNVLTGDEMERGILSKQMRVVPNPTNGPAAVHMELTEMGTGSLSIIGMNGKVVHKIENVTVKQGRNTIPINVQGFSPGLYFVEFISKQGTLTGKLSVMK
ncbi:MAG TPA: T9SS type A sorting domain-containing protein, partial [Bacteroidales bacterium]|nr:T9SS type A sorting domain-containing protein [Bacteroidales bacterium]